MNPTLDETQLLLRDTVRQYLEAEGHRITASEFRANLSAKLDHAGFRRDCMPLLRPGTPFDLQSDFNLVDHTLISRLERPPSDERAGE